MRWILPQVIEEQATALARALDVHPLVARVLVARGQETADKARAFLADRLADLPDPLLLRGMPEAIARLARALRSNEKITLYGDYDVDGVCSTTLLKLFLEELGASVAAYLPHRLEEGYGLNLAAVERIAADGTRVLVTLDCGITSESEVQRAKDLGLDTVIVDHHTVPTLLPPAVAVINPHQPGCRYPTQHLCAAGVAFNLCMAMRRHLRESGFFNNGRKEPNLRALMDLVALATVADVVPLTGVNRILVRHGLEELTQARRPGIQALKEVAGLDVGAKVTAGQVGFRLGPRINAAGRLDDASMGMRLLCAQTLEEARPLAKALDQANAERQGIEQEILHDALAQAATQTDHRGLLLYGEGWHPGVIGIVASRIVERFHRPTVVIGIKDGVGKGSGRSIEAFHLFDALSGCSSLLSRFGGHKHAAGLTVEAAQLEALRSAFTKVADERLCDEDLIPRCKVDAVVRLNELDEQAVVALERLAPFGAGNPEPVLVLRNMSASPRVLPNKNGEGRGGHLKLSLEAAPRLDVIGFGMADRASLTEGPVDLAFQACMDEWKGVRRMQLKLKALRTSN